MASALRTDGGLRATFRDPFSDPNVMRDVEAFLGRGQSIPIADRHHATGTYTEYDSVESPKSYAIARPGAG